MGGSSDGPEVKDSEDQKAMAQVAKAKWELYQKKFVPLENEWMADIDTWNDKKQYDRAAAIGNLNTHNAYGEAMKNLVSQGGNSSQLNANINKIALGLNKARTDNVSRMQVNQQNQYVAGLQNINRVGMGKETESLKSMSDAAGISQSYAFQQAKNDYSDGQQWNDLAGMGIGAAMRGGIE